MSKEIIDTWLYDNHLLRVTIPKQESKTLILPRARINEISEKIKRTLYYIKFPMHKDDFQPYYTTTVEPFLTDSIEQLGVENLKRILQSSIVSQEQTNTTEIYNIHLGSIPVICNKLLSYYH